MDKMFIFVILYQELYPSRLTMNPLMGLVEWLFFKIHCQPS